MRVETQNTKHLVPQMTVVMCVQEMLQRYAEGPDQHQSILQVGIIAFGFTFIGSFVIWMICFCSG